MLQMFNMLVWDVFSYSSEACTFFPSEQVSPTEKHQHFQSLLRKPSPSHASDNVPRYQVLTVGDEITAHTNLFCCQDHRWPVSKYLVNLFLEKFPLLTVQIPSFTTSPITNISVELLPYSWIPHWHLPIGDPPLKNLSIYKYLAAIYHPLRDPRDKYLSS